MIRPTRRSSYMIAPGLILAFLPVLVVIALLFTWSLDWRKAIYAMSRMLGQLLLIGYFLAYIFEAKNAWVIIAVLAVMISASSWISLGNVKNWQLRFYKNALCAIALGGGTTLILVTQGVLALDPWYLPRFMIPLAGMIFAACMNSVSLAAERFQAEFSRNVSYTEARAIALKASLIPKTNSLFAVGLVSLPGMMTGQILSGVSPLIAARYQIMVMCMIYGAAGIASAVFLLLIKKHIAEASPKTA